MKFILVILILSSSFHAYSETSILSYYIFENKGSAGDGRVNISTTATVVQISRSWWSWKCLATRQEDGVLLSCTKGDDNIETKLYCKLPQAKFPRYLRFNNGNNFVSFEVSCKK